MNMRGMLALYAGFAAVLGGVWLWVRTDSFFSLGLIGCGFAIALGGVVYIVRAARTPGAVKTGEVKRAVAAPRAGKKVRKVPAVEDDGEADAIAVARMARIAARTSAGEDLQAG